MTIDWKALAEPFPTTETEWRIGQAGKSNGRIWAKVLIYIQARAIQNRLDRVLGPEGWKNEFKPGPDGGVVCGLSIRLDDGEWLTKWDGADNTDIEGVKGGLSNSTKRAAVQWGIGRYLYSVSETFAEISEEKKPGYKYANCKVKVNGKDEYIQFYWQPPELPDWARPSTKPNTSVPVTRSAPSKTSGESINEFWMYAREAGVSKEVALKCVEEHGKDYVAALEAIKQLQGAK